MRLGTLLARPELGLTLLVGADAVDRPIQRVVTATLRDPSRYLSGGELVLSGEEWWQGPREAEAFVAALARAGVAALAAGTAELAGPVPDHVVEACRRHRVPLLAVAEHVSFATISEQVILGLAAERAPAGTALDRHRRLVAAAASGLDALVRAGAAEVGADCWVLNAAGRVIAASGSGEPLDTGRLAGRYLRADRLPVVVAGRTLLGVPSKSRAASWLLVVDGEHREHRPEMATELATLVGLERSRLEEARRVENRTAEPLVRVLLSENASPSEIHSRLAASGLTEQDKIVAVSTGEQAFAVIDDLLSALPGKALVAAVEGEVFGLVAATGPTSVVTEVKNMVQVVKPARFAIGISAATGNPRTAILEARYARRLAESSPDRVAVVGGDEVASHQLLLAAVPDELRRSFQDRVLGPVLAYDAKHKSELLHTLRVFLECSGSWAQAAAELHLHVNTLRYRMGRVAELTGRDLTRFADRVDLYLALSKMD